MLSTRLIYSLPKNNTPSFNFSRNLCSLKEVPYKNREEFIAKTQGAFRPIKNSYGIQLKNAAEAEEMAWSIYKTTAESTSLKPAITYTGKDYDFLPDLESKYYMLHGGQRECLEKTGRLYDPEVHTWSANATWLLAQAHKCRDIIAISDACYPYSAFTKELTCAFRAGYTVADLSYIDDEHSLIHFAAPAAEQTAKLSLSDFLTTLPDECKVAQEKYNTEKQALLKKFHASQARNSLLTTCPPDLGVDVEKIAAVYAPKPIANSHAVFFQSKPKLAEASERVASSHLASVKP